MKLNEAVDNPYVSWLSVFCFSKVLTNEEYEKFLDHMEKKTGLNLYAKQSQVQEQLHGFITKCIAMPPYCGWGNHITNKDHTTIILSLHKEHVPGDLTAIGTAKIHCLEKVILTKELEKLIQDGYSSFPV